MAENWQPQKADAFPFTILMKKCSKKAAVDNCRHPDLKGLQYSSSLNIILGRKDLQKGKGMHYE